MNIIYFVYNNSIPSATASLPFCHKQLHIHVTAYVKSMCLVYMYFPLHSPWFWLYMLNKWQTDKLHEKLKDEEDKAVSETFLIVNFQRNITVRCVWLRPYENNADKEKRDLPARFCCLLTEACRGKELSQANRPPTSFSAKEGAAEDEDNKTLGFTKTTLSPIMAMDKNEWCERY